MVISISILISLFLVSQEISITFALFKRLWRPHFLCMYSCQQKEKQKVLSCDSGNLSPPINLLFSPVTPHYDPHTPRQTHTSDDRSESLSGGKKKVKQNSKPILCCWGNWWRIFQKMRGLCFNRVHAVTGASAMALFFRMECDFLILYS